MHKNGDFDPTRFGYVFNIQRYTLHDGPGIRTMVFVNGCPLRCRWCSNPESQSWRPELAVNRQKCIGTAECGSCLKACPPGALTSAEDGKIAIDRQRCDLCMECVAVCPSEALHAFGALRSVREVIAAVEADGVFFSRSGGGMTISGGEPLVQSEFVVSLLREARRRRIDTAIETCGHVDWEVLRKAAEFCNTVFFDIKCMDPEKHREFVGVDNALILGNLGRLAAEFPQLSIIVRTPLIPGFNDSPEAISRIMAFLEQFPAIGYEVLPYHRLGSPKYEYLGRAYPLGDATLNPATEKAIRQLAKQFSEARRSGTRGVPAEPGDRAAAGIGD